MTTKDDEKIQIKNGNLLIPTSLILGAVVAIVAGLWPEIRKGLVSSAHAAEFVTQHEYDEGIAALRAELDSRHKWMMDQQKQMGQVQQLTTGIKEKVDDVDERQRSLTNQVKALQTPPGAWKCK